MQVVMVIALIPFRVVSQGLVKDQADAVFASSRHARRLTSYVRYLDATTSTDPGPDMRPNRLDGGPFGLSVAAVGSAERHRR